MRLPYSEGEQVFICRDSSFYLLFDFGAEVGDTIVVFDTTFSPILDPYQGTEGDYNYFAYAITKVDSVERNGIWLKRQEVESIGDWTFYNIVELEGALGWVGMLGDNPKIFFTGDHYGYSLCYNDGTYIFPLTGSPLLCNDPVGIESNLNETEITVSPNPAHSFIDFKFPILDKPHQVKIYNALGQLVAETDLFTGTSQKQIDVTELRSGLYFWQLGDIMGKLMIE